MLQEINVLLTANIQDLLAKFMQARAEAAKLNEIGNINASPDINIDHSRINDALQNGMPPVDANTRLTLGFNPVELDLSAVSLTDIGNAINSKLSNISAAIKLIINPEPIEINTANISQTDVENALNAKLSTITAPLKATINLSADINTDALTTSAIKSAINTKIASVGNTAVNQKAKIVIDPDIDTSRISASSIKTALNNAMAMIGNLNNSLNAKIVIDIGIATAQNRLNVLIRQAQQLIAILRAPIIININSGASVALIAQLQAQIAALQAQLNGLGNGGGNGGGGGPGEGFLGSLKNIFAQVGAIMGTVIALKWFANANSEMEQYRMQIGVLVKDTERAETILQELKTFADKTPYETGEVVRAGKQLMAAGIMDYKTYLTTAGDWAAAVGVKLEETVGAMARANAGQFGEAIERMRELGISTQDLWGQGLQFSKSNEFLGTADQLMTALNNIVRDKAGGMMDVLSQSWSGLASTAKSQIEDLSRALSEPFFNAAKGGLKTFTDEFQNMKNGGGLAKITAEVQSFADLLGGIENSIVSMFSNTNIGTGLLDVFASLYQVCKDIISIIGNVVKALTDLASASGAFSLIGSSLQTVTQAIRIVSETITSWIRIPEVVDAAIFSFVAFKVAANFDAVINAIGLSALAIEAAMIRIRTALATGSIITAITGLTTALNFTVIAANISNGAAVIGMAFKSIGTAAVALLAANPIIAVLATAIGYAGVKYYEMKQAQDAATQSQKNAADMQTKLAEATKVGSKSQQELAQKAMADAFAKEKQVQADIQNEEKRAETKSRLNKAMGMDSVELAKIEYESAQKSLNATIDADTQARAVKTKMAQQNIANAKTTEERTKAEKQLADIQKDSLVIEERKADVAEKQAAYYQSLINKQAELGQYVYASMKLSAEVAMIEKMGGDATVKRYAMVKSAMAEYMSEMDKIKTVQDDVANSKARMNIVMSNIDVPHIEQGGSIWTDKEKEVVSYKKAVGFNLAEIALLNDQQESKERIDGINRLSQRIQIIDAMLRSEKLGAEQRKQLIVEEAGLFANYTKSVTDGIVNAMQKIQSLQSKAISSANSVMSVLDKFFPESSYQGMKTMLAVAEDAWRKTDTHSVEQMNAMLALQARAKELNITPTVKITAADVINAGVDEVKNIGATIETLKANMKSLIEQAKQIGAEAANNYFAEWNGYINQLKQTMGDALITMGATIDTSQASQSIDQIKQQFTDTVKGMQTQVTVELPKPTINYNTFQQSFKVDVNIQGNTLKDLGDAVENARNLFGQELKSAFMEANAQYGF